MLSTRLADWLDIAHAVYLADRLVLRGTSLASHAGANWSRRLTVRICVHEVVFWSSIADKIAAILTFLTQDQWNLVFVAGKPSRPMQGYLFSSVPPTADVLLFSGGLDSFAGAITHRKENPGKHAVLVSGFTNSRIQKAQYIQAEFVSSLGSGLTNHIAVGMGLRNQGNPKDLEPTQRTRGFFHLSLGCISALAFGGNRVVVNENGVGALNLPFDRSQLGAQNSRPVNPITLSKMASLARVIGEGAFTITNRFIFETKAAMCIAADSGRHLFHDTMSCDRPQRSFDGWHCGVCTSCLLRRMSLNAAGITPELDQTKYVADLKNGARPQKDWQMAEKMEWQAQRLSKLLKDDSAWEVLSKEFPMLSRVASHLDLRNEEASDKIVALLREHVAQWMNLPFRERLRPQLLEAA